ncbi:YcdB/YcdC domain-containing protein [Clostridium sp. DJ247]|uniref:YcdB/YcdC domain-containing protein n=1 Tax=Clostridium sp. DJ247 TaxID=2726188 RepID=UPI00162A69A4|nr:YcdB/YcdC domain-containing protein [Clostridium sp. DJ247]MBC2581489.1 hypothetical protein [Clostridium sp. DJ247]
MKSKRTVLLVLTAALIISSKPVFAKETNKDVAANTPALTISSKTATEDTIALSSEKSKAKVSQEQAKETAKQILKDYFETTIDDTKFQNNVNFNSNYFNGTKRSVWDIQWYNQGNDTHISIHVSVDGTTGKVLNVDRHEFDTKQSSPAIATITQDQAKDIGEAFLKKINPQEFKETTPVKNNDSIPYYGISNYRFVYNRTINDIPFTNNNISVGVDGVTGKVTSYGITWDNTVNAPAADKALDQKQADDIFNKNTKLNLNYNSYINKPNITQENKIKLVYSTDSSSPLIIDAANGKALTWNGQSIENVKTRNITDKQKEDIFKNAKPVQRFNNPINSERAEQVLKDKVKDLFGDGYELNSINYDENGYGYIGKDLKTWSADFTKKGSNTNFGPPEGRIAINALTEQIVRIDKFNFDKVQDEKFQPKLNWEQAYDKAIQSIAKNYPEKIKEINTEQKDFSNQNYIYAEGPAKRYITFSFARIVNDIPFNNNYKNESINITFDTKTGDMNSFACLWQDKLDLPPAVNTISNDEAKKTFLDANKPKLTYLLFNDINNTDKSNSKIQLVYSIGQNSPLSSIDAYTGKLLNIFGENIDNNIEEFKSKIKGSAVEKEASILASQGIIDTKDFKLDAGITRLQLIKILVNAKGFNPYLKGLNDLGFTSGLSSKDSTEYKYVQLAVMYGIIEDKKEDFKANELVTREELAKSLVKLLGYDRIAEIKGLLNLPYSDSSTISTDKTGYVSLAGGLKLIETTSDGKIRPKDTVTMSELIKAVYVTLGTLKR